jgi:hypothetical protein
MRATPAPNGAIPVLWSDTFQPELAGMFDHGRADIASYLRVELDAVGGFGDDASLPRCLRRLFFFRSCN